MSETAGESQRRIQKVEANSNLNWSMMFDPNVLYEDVDALSNLYGGMVPQDELVPRFILRLRDRIRTSSNPNSPLYTACDEQSKVQAYAGFEPFSINGETGKNLSLYVHRDFRNQSIGSSLKHAALIDSFQRDPELPVFSILLESNRSVIEMNNKFHRESLPPNIQVHRVDSPYIVYRYSLKH